MPFEELRNDPRSQAQRSINADIAVRQAIAPQQGVESAGFQPDDLVNMGWGKALKYGMAGVLGKGAGEEGFERGFGELSKAAVFRVQKLMSTLARQLSGNPEMQKDLSQVGMETLAKGVKPGMNPNTVAKRDMTNYAQSQFPGNNHTVEARLLDRAKSELEQKLGHSIGNEDSMALYRAMRDMLPPQKRSEFSLDRFNALRNAQPNRPVSMEETLGDSMTRLGDTIGGGDNPEEIAQLRQQFNRLTDQQRNNVYKTINEADDIDPKIKQRILLKLRNEGPTPISGGSGAGRPLPPGAYDTQQIFNTPEQFAPGMSTRTLRGTMETPLLRDAIQPGNPPVSQTTARFNLSHPVDTEQTINAGGRTLYGNSPGAVEEGLPPGMKPGANIFELIDMVKRGLVNTGRN